MAPDEIDSEAKGDRLELELEEGDPWDVWRSMMAIRRPIGLRKWIKGAGMILSFVLWSKWLMLVLWYKARRIRLIDALRYNTGTLRPYVFRRLVVHTMADRWIEDQIAETYGDTIPWGWLTAHAFAEARMKLNRIDRFRLGYYVSMRIDVTGDADDEAQIGLTTYQIELVSSAMWVVGHLTTGHFSGRPFLAQNPRSYLERFIRPSDVTRLINNVAIAPA